MGGLTINNEGGCQFCREISSSAMIMRHDFEYCPNCGARLTDIDTNLADLLEIENVKIFKEKLKEMEETK